MLQKQNLIKNHQKRTEINNYAFTALFASRISLLSPRLGATMSMVRKSSFLPIDANKEVAIGICQQFWPPVPGTL
jgi:hypothetical protein